MSCVVLADSASTSEAPRSGICQRTH